MKIKKMTARFGCLNGAELALEDGLNVVTLPNERGKSTWCAFILAMLYGVDSSERAKAGYMPDKQRYAPWSGAPMEGEMEIAWGGRDITLRRTTRTANAPMREFSATYTGTGERVPELTGLNAGETLTGVSRDVLSRSAFIRQGAVSVDRSSELDKKIAAIVSSGEEDTSFAEADARLGEWQRRRRYNKIGAIPRLAGELEEQRALLEKLSLSADERETLSAELERLKKEDAALSAKIEESRGLARGGAAAALEAAKARVQTCEQTVDAVVEASAARKAEFDSGPFGTSSPDEVAENAGGDAKRAEGLLKIAEKRSSLLPVGILAALCAICIALGLAFSWYAYIPAAAFAVVAVGIYSVVSAKNRLAAKCGGERDKILRKYGAADESGIRAAADLHAKRWEEMNRAKSAETDARAALDAARKAQGEAEKTLLAEAEPEETARLVRARNELTDRTRALSARLAELVGSIRTLGDPMAIGSDVREKEARLAQLEVQYREIGLARETLSAADAEIRGRFSPALARAAAAYMSRLTDGRYTALELTRDFTAKTRLAGDTVPHEAAFMSAGASDLMYLAVRLAICELALPGEGACPLVMDDVLVNFDPERAERAMALFTEIAQKRQAILFTCK